MNNFNPYKVITELVDLLPEKSRYVVLQRYGLLDGERKTLESIGEKYGITRERVRQIENASVNFLTQEEHMKKLTPFFKLLHSHIEDHGDLRHEDKLLMEDHQIILPENTQKYNQSAAIYFLLKVGKPFNRYQETEDHHSLWSTNKSSYGQAIKVINYAVKRLAKDSKLVSYNNLLDLLDEAMRIVTKKKANWSQKVLNSYLDISKKINKNVYGEYGLSHWGDVNPAGVRDRAYVVMKKNLKPLHFTEVADLINKTYENIESGFRKANAQTVHNELIKDKRFVLVGRGTYALSEMGYEQGTVKELLLNMFKKSKQPIGKEQILKEIQDKKLVKENTILINLNDRNIFQRTNDGRYKLAK